MKQGLYEQIINNLTRKQLAKLDLSEFDIGREPLDPEEARKMLANYLATVIRKALKMVREQSLDGNEAVLDQVKICNEIIATLKSSLGQAEYEDQQLDEQGEVLTYVYSNLNRIRSVKDTAVLRPLTPLSQSSLFTGAHSEPNMLNELQREIVTADRVDLLISFIKWSGLRCLMEQLAQFTRNGGGNMSRICLM